MGGLRTAFSSSLYPMLLFYHASEKALSDFHAAGRSPNAPTGVRLHTALAGAQAAHSGPVLVVDAAALPGGVPSAPGPVVFVPAVPAAAVRNLGPYRRPEAVTAAGGYVMRREESAPGVHSGEGGEPEVLLIYRRGAWDLPKGKQDPGESIPDCALREVREEVGIEALRLVRPLGATVHGYADGDIYAVKTTHWFWMETPERAFEPERREGIERVEWAAWPEAKARLGYATLQRHMEAVEASVRGS